MLRDMDSYKLDSTDAMLFYVLKSRFDETSKYIAVIGDSKRFKNHIAQVKKVYRKIPTIRYIQTDNRLIVETDDDDIAIYIHTPDIASLRGYKFKAFE